MRVILKLIAAAVVLFSATMSWAQATTYANGNPNVCQPVASSVSLIERTSWGVCNTNTGSTNAEVLCPVNLKGESGNYFVVKVYNRNASVNFTCTLYKLNTDGSVASSSSQSVSGSLNSSVQQLSWSSPSESSNMYVDCVIPPVVSGQASYVVWLGRVSS